MSWFPQIGSGSIAQFPLTRSRTWRAIMNRLESGEQIMLPDANADRIEWRLSFQDLTSEETSALTSLFASLQGAFGTFLFIDPAANLLGWSEDLSQPNWQTGLLAKAGSMTDPLGTQRAWSISNSSPGVQALEQTLGVPGDYVACFSAWFRGNAAGTVTMQRDNNVMTMPVGAVWERRFLSGTGAGGAAQSSFSIAVAPGQSIDVWGLQVEAQPYPSAYKPTRAPEGIFEETWFEDNELPIASTSPGLSSCDVRLISRV